jgi:hypothetical protein
MTSAVEMLKLVRLGIASAELFILPERSWQPKLEDRTIAQEAS